MPEALQRLNSELWRRKLLLLMAIVAPNALAVWFCIKQENLELNDYLGYLLRAGLGLALASTFFLAACCMQRVAGGYGSEPFRAERVLPVACLSCGAMLCAVCGFALMLLSVQHLCLRIDALTEVDRSRPLFDTGFLLLASVPGVLLAVAVAYSAAFRYRSNI